MCIRDIPLPPYTKKMELWNAITHGLGVLFILVFGPMAIVKACESTDWLGILATVICVLFFLILYLGSTLYHALPQGNAKRVFRVLDHNNIFLQVMGSYAPFCLIALRHPADGFPWGWVIFGLVWGLSILGIIFNSINIYKYRVLSMIIYVAMGSVVLVAFYPLNQAIGLNGVLMTLSSGILYWIGAVLYGVAKKKTHWIHTVFHVFVLGGSILMFLSIYLFVL